MKKRNFKDLVYFYPTEQFNNIDISTLDTEDSIENYILYKIECYKSLEEIKANEISLILKNKIKKKKFYLINSCFKLEN